MRLPEEVSKKREVTSSPVDVESRREYDIDLIGPAQSNGRWRQVQGTGFDISNFQVDWDREKVICPAGHESSRWKPMGDGRGNDFIHAQFARSDCSVCPHLSQCTSAKGRRRTVNFNPKELYEALRQNRRRENAGSLKRNIGIERELKGPTRYCWRIPRPTLSAFRLMAVAAREQAPRFTKIAQSIPAA
jgi:hypothetical protein